MSQKSTQARGVEYISLNLDALVVMVEAFIRYKWILLKNLWIRVICGAYLCMSELWCKICTLVSEYSKNLINWTLFYDVRVASLGKI